MDLISHSNEYFTWLNIMHCILYGFHAIEFEDE